MNCEPRTVHEMIARKREADKRIAEAAQRRAEAAKRVTEARKTLEREQVALAAEVDEPLPSHPVRRFLTLFALENGVTYADLVGLGRPAYLVGIRHRAIAALAEFRPNYSLSQIGAEFGDRDHTTILHALRKVNGRRYRHRSAVASQQPGNEASQ